MKTLKLLSASLLVAFGATAQPVLNSSDFSDVNQDYVFSTLVDLTLDYSSTGANYTWDFSTLTPTGQRWQSNRPVSEAGQLSQLFFGSFAAAAYKANYWNQAVDLPLDQLTASFPVSLDGISLFTKNTSTSINSVGYEMTVSGQGIGVKSDTIEHRYELPLEYGDNYSSRGYTKLNMNPIYDAQWIQHRGRMSNVDGWGTVQTPWGTFNALRIHHIIQEVDSFYVTINGNGTWIPIPVPVSHIYEWRSLDDKEAVMTIKTSEVASNEVITGVEYRDYYNGLGVENKSITVTTYPNPATNNVEFSLNSRATYLSLIDMRGQVVFQKTMDAATGNIDISNFAAGSYNLVINTDEGVTSTVIIKK